MREIRLVTDTVMARRLGVRAAWLRAEANAGHLPHVKAGDRFLFDPELVESLLHERAQQQPVEAPHHGQREERPGEHPELGRVAGVRASAR